MKLSVVIPCKNEAGTIEHLLDSLLAQTRSLDEIIVVDSHSTDTTAAVARGYIKVLPIAVIRAEQKGVTHARNEGAAKASGDLLFFIDADVVLPPHFFEKAERAIKKRRLNAGCFPQKMNAQSFGLRFGSFFMNLYVALMSITPMPIAFSCLFMAKKYHDKIGGFDPKLWIMEDYDYVFRGRKAGAKFGIICTSFIASPRRFEGEESHSILKAVYAEMYRYLHGMRITKPLYTYDMSGQKRVRKKSKTS